MLFVLCNVGNKGTHLFRLTPTSRAWIQNTGAVIRPLSANFGTSSALVRHSDGNSTYNAMTLEYRRRAIRGLNLQANWTWAKAIDDLDLNPQAGGLNAVSPGRHRGNSAYARRHQINVNGTYQVPFGRGLAFGSHLSPWANSLLGGWLVSGTWHWNTGIFLTPTPLRKAVSPTPDRISCRASAPISYAIKEQRATGSIRLPLSPRPCSTPRRTCHALAMLHGTR